MVDDKKKKFREIQGGKPEASLPPMMDAKALEQATGQMKAMLGVTELEGMVRSFAETINATAVRVTAMSQFIIKAGIVSEEDLNKRVDEIGEDMHKQLEEAMDKQNGMQLVDREVQIGDVAYVLFDAACAGKNIINKSLMPLNTNTPPSNTQSRIMLENVMGMKAGQEKAFIVDVPIDEEGNAFAGKKIDVVMSVQKVKAIIAVKTDASK